MEIHGRSQSLELRIMGRLSGFPDAVGEIASGIPWMLRLRMLQVEIRLALESMREQQDILFAKKSSRDVEGGRLPCRTETIRS